MNLIVSSRVPARLSLLDKLLCFSVVREVSSGLLDSVFVGSRRGIQMVVGRVWYIFFSKGLDFK